MLLELHNKSNLKPESNSLKLILIETLDNHNTAYFQFTLCFPFLLKNIDVAFLKKIVITINFIEGSEAESKCRTSSEYKLDKLE